MGRVQHEAIAELAGTLLLGALLERVRERWGRYELVDHWKQGEFHHDVVIRVPAANGELPGSVLIVATNCNGGIKEVLCLAEAPDRMALWHGRCPGNPEFSGAPPRVLGSATTVHWFDPCELLLPDARSEYRDEFKARQCGGGWMPRKPSSA